MSANLTNEHPHLLDSPKKASVIILVNGENKILLQHRTKDAPTAPNKWAFFGGGVDDGEDPHIAVLRETTEELGITIENPRLIIARIMDHPTFDEEYIYIKKIDDNKINSIKQAEGQDKGWFSLGQALQLDMVADKKAILPAIFEYVERIYGN